MANRVLIGNRATGGYGLYVSKDGDDVLTDDGLLFDSRTGTGWGVATYGQGSIVWNGADVTITHNLGYNPVVAIRWSHTITSGVATEVYSPCWSEHMVEATTYAQATMYYAYIIFNEPDFTGGRGI